MEKISVYFFGTVISGKVPSSTVKLIEELFPVIDRERSFKWISVEEKVAVLTALYYLFKAGVSASEAFKTLALKGKTDVERGIGLVGYVLMRKGESLTKVFKLYQFHESVVFILESSLTFGKLAESLRAVAFFYEKVEKLKKHLTASMVYPTILNVVAIAIVLFVRFFVIPSFNSNPLLLQARTEASIVAQKVLEAFSMAYPLTIALTAMGFAFLKVYKDKSYKVQEFLLFKSGPLGRLLVSWDKTLVFYALGYALKNGVHLKKAFEFLYEAYDNVFIKEAFKDAIKQIERGVKDVELKLLTPIESTMVNFTSDRSTLGDTFLLLSKKSEEETIKNTKAMASILYSFSLIVVAFVVVLIVLTVFVPYVNFIKSISK